MIKNNNFIAKPIYLIVWVTLFSLLCAYSIPTHANNTSNSKKTKLSANFNSQQDAVKNWFNNFDQIRRQSQLAPAERQKADEIMAKGLSIFMPGADKALAQNLLANLVKRYDIAAQQMANLPIIPATEQLHRAYYQYFIDARHLFSDYLKLQDDLLATDPSTGQPVASGLVERKENLAVLDQNNKILDEQLRQQYGVSAYQYQSSTAPPNIQHQYQSGNAQENPALNGAPSHDQFGY